MKKTKKVKENGEEEATKEKDNKEQGGEEKGNEATKEEKPDEEAVKDSEEDDTSYRTPNVVDMPTGEQKPLIRQDAAGFRRGPVTSAISQEHESSRPAKHEEKAPVKETAKGWMLYKACLSSAVPLNPDFSKLQGKRKLVREIESSIYPNVIPDPTPLIISSIHDFYA